MKVTTAIASAVAVILTSCHVLAQDDDSHLSIILPTANDALFKGGGADFFMGTYRRPKRNVQPGWTAGQYGFVRDVRHTRHGMVYSRFHEGIDVRPLRRDRRGDPLDQIMAISDGEVVYVSRHPSRSNYGLYIVVEHWWGRSPIYSLYAHLGSISVDIGETIRQGDVIGRMGYTGRGINRDRAHLHLELNMMLSEAFNHWYDDHKKHVVPNYHQLYNGLNLVGIDIERLYHELRENPDLTLPEFIAQETGAFEVMVPAGPMLPDILWRYPWMCEQLHDWLPEYGPPIELGTSWKITFASSGLPLKFEPMDEIVRAPKLKMLERSPIPYHYLTNGLVRGSGDNFFLSESGQQRMDLISRSALDLHNSEWDQR